MLHIRTIIYIAHIHIVNSNKVPRYVPVYSKTTLSRFFKLSHLRTIKHQCTKIYVHNKISLTYLFRISSQCNWRERVFRLKWFSISMNTPYPTTWFPVYVRITIVYNTELRIREMFSRIRIRPKIFFTDPGRILTKIQSFKIS